MLDALVIGAGPSGSRTAWNLAKAGYSTTLVEEHEIVGEPCQCAGLITPRTFEYLGSVSYTHLTLPTTPYV